MVRGPRQQPPTSELRMTSGPARETSMSGWSGPGRPRGWSAFTMGSGHRRRIILGVLLAGVAVSRVLIPFVPAAAISVTAIFVVSLGLDLVLLPRRQILLAERLMTAAFQSSRLPGDHPLR